MACSWHWSVLRFVLTESRKSCASKIRLPGRARAYQWEDWTLGFLCTREVTEKYTITPHSYTAQPKPQSLKCRNKRRRGYCNSKRHNIRTYWWNWWFPLISFFWHSGNKLRRNIIVSSQSCHLNFSTKWLLVSSSNSPSQVRVRPLTA